jgi:hypothetical protein
MKRWGQFTLVARVYRPNDFVGRDREGAAFAAFEFCDKFRDKHGTKAVTKLARGMKKLMKISGRGEGICSVPAVPVRIRVR